MTIRGRSSILHPPILNYLRLRRRLLSLKLFMQLDPLLALAGYVAEGLLEEHVVRDDEVLNLLVVQR